MHNIVHKRDVGIHSIIFLRNVNIWNELKVVRYLQSIHWNYEAEKLFLE